MEYLLNCGVSVEMQVKLALPVGGRADGSEVNIDWMCSDPWSTCWSECIVRNVLNPGEGGEVRETVDVKERKL